MKYYIIAKESKRGADGMIAVRVLFREGTREFVVSTGIRVRKPFAGVSLDPKEQNYMAKVRRLAAMTEEADRYILENVKAPFEEKKRRLTAIVTGEQVSEGGEPLADRVDEYAATLERKGTRDLYALTARKVRAYDGTATLEDVDAAWLEGFARAQGDVSVNYRSILERNIRTVFNWAIDNGWTENYPFRRYRIRSEKVAINNITVEQLRQVRDYPLDDWRRVYRDFFMLTFYLCGINTIDLLNLRPGDMRNGRIRYKRAKTGRLYDIPVPPEAAEIIARYRGRRFLLDPLERYRSHKDFAHHWNDALKKIGPVEIVPDRAGRMRKMAYRPIVEGMTVYTARYTFASIGAELDIPRETIALCLGHAWTDVTSHYISYDNRKIDAAVRRIIDYVNGE